MKKNKKNGFTLLEILMSFAIFSIYAVTIPSILSFYEDQIKIEETKSQKDISSILSEIERSYQQKKTDFISETYINISLDNECTDKYYAVDISESNKAVKKERTCTDISLNQEKLWPQILDVSFDKYNEKDNILSIQFLAKDGSTRTHYIKR